MFTVTGLVMWFGKGAVPPTAFVWSVILHDLSVIATVAWFMLHVYLVAVHPIHRESITSMFEGTVTEEYARASRQVDCGEPISEAWSGKLGSETSE